jgi:multiple sugar transport system substrate-binding protein
MNKKVIIIIVSIALIIGIVLVVILLSNPKPSPKNINLVIWDPFDTKEEWQPFIDGYKKYLTENKISQEVNITFVKKDYQNLEDYEKDFTNAIADGKGPDIFLIKNDWLPKHYKKILPLPEKIISRKEYEKRFLPSVLDEQIKYKFNEQKNIYGIPLTVDALMLIYNPQKIITNETITWPPDTWEQFIAATTTSTKREGNTIIQSGVALGTYNNVPHAFDILSLMMLQNGTQMVSDNEEEAYFNRFETRNNQDYYPGTAALKMYTAFASPKSQAYSWNSSMPNALDAFLGGKTAMFLGYPEDIQTILKENPNQSLNTCPVPQVKRGDKNNYLSFWMYSVSKNCQNPEMAWNLLNFITSEQGSQLLTDYYSKKDNLCIPSVTAIKASGQAKPAAEYAETAQSWYKGDALKMENIFSKMITSVNNNQPPQAAIDAAAKEADNLFKEIKSE